MMKKTLIGTAGIGVLSGLYWWEAKSIPAGTAMKPGISYFPNLLGEAALGLCILLAIVVYLKNRKQSGAASDGPDEKVGSGPWIISVALLLYPVAMDNFGFVFSTVPLAYVSMWIMGYRRKFKGLAISLIMVFVLDYVFSEWLGVRFPQGWLS